MRGRLGVGERGPDFVWTDASGVARRFYAHAGGRPIALLFHHDSAEVADLLAGREDVSVLAVAEPAVAQAYGVAGEPTVVVLDPNLRTVAIVTGEHPVEQVLALLEAAIHRGPRTRVRAQAPVLFVPGVLDGAQCERLIQRAEEHGTIDTGVERAAGTEMLDASYKRRRDHAVGDPELLRELSSVIGRRVMPELQKAFAYRATRFEGFKIARYDASAGFFRPHRDNLTDFTRHRAFALTINLNDAYDGGELAFPEYGNQLYRPDAGTALVFSCAHLHEVRDVTAGQRYVLLSFLYDAPTGPSPG